MNEFSGSSLADWLVHLEGLHPVEIELKLERVGKVLRTLKLDTPPYTVITVAGTNGKGSSVAMLDAIYAAAGYLTGTYTSPHLSRYNERIRVAGDELGDAAIVDAFRTIEAARGQTSLTYFEFSTIAALLSFRRLGVQVAVLEVGMGGRLDAVNAVAADAALVTSIGLDHQQWLGPDRESIGREKAGIFRAGRPAVIADPDPPAALGEVALATGARPRFARRDMRALPAADGQGWHWLGAARRYDDLPPLALRGAFQLDNAVGVVAVVDALQERLPVSEQALRSGLGELRLDGRFEVVAGAPTWIFDVAHNAESAVALAANLAAIGPAPVTLAIVGMLADKPAQALVRSLAPHVDRWIAVTPPSTRALSARDMAAVIAGETGLAAREFDDVAAACNAARDAAAGGWRIVVTGSFYVVGPARDWRLR